MSLLLLHLVLLLLFGPFLLALLHLLPVSPEVDPEQGGDDVEARRHQEEGRGKRLQGGRVQLLEDGVRDHGTQGGDDGHGGEDLAHLVHSHALGEEGAGDRVLANGEAAEEPGQVEI